VDVPGLVTDGLPSPFRKNEYFDIVDILTRDGRTFFPIKRAACLSEAMSASIPFNPSQFLKSICLAFYPLEDNWQ
jgi:hypothetical protein